MNTDQPAPDGQEKGLSFWVRVPTGASRLAVDFRARIEQVAAADGIEIRIKNSVSPGRPSGRDVKAQDEPGKTQDGSSDAADSRLGRPPFTLQLAIPALENPGDTPYQVEIGPLSWSQGWIEGKAEFANPAEPPGHGPTWRGGQHVILVSFVSLDALQDEPPPARPDADESGVFAWVKLPALASSPGWEAPFRATFVAKTDGVAGPVIPAEASRVDVPPASDAIRILRTLASIELPEGRWSLSAVGPADSPAGSGYGVVAGPRSRAREWIETSDEGRAWRDGGAVVALLTLTTRYDPL